MSTFAAVAERITQPQAASDKTEHDHGSLQIRANTLVIGNSIYPVANISAITFSDLRNPVPLFVWIMLGAGVLGIVMGDTMALLGLALLAAAAWLLYLNRTARSAADYSLTIQMNSGRTAVVMSDDGNFLKAIALDLYGVIEFERPTNSTYNIDQSVRIDSMSGSTVGITGIRGDIVNAVQRM